MPRYISSRIQNKLDTISNWSTINPVLLQGELSAVIDDDNLYLKIGDGVTSWNALNYIKSKVSDSVDYLSIEYILLANTWSASNEYIISIGGGNENYISSTSLQLIFPNSNISKEQLIAAQKALIIDTGVYTEDSFTIKCLGVKPNIDIPIRIIIFR